MPVVLDTTVDKVEGVPDKCPKCGKPLILVLGDPSQYVIRCRACGAILGTHDGEASELFI